MKAMLSTVLLAGGCVIMLQAAPTEPEPATPSSAPAVTPAPPPAPATTTAAPGSTEIVKDRPGESPQIYGDAQMLLATGQYDALEKMHQDLLQADARYPDGTSKLGTLYSALGRPLSGDTDDKWQEHIKKIEAWHAAKPDSFLPAVAYGETMTSYAWKARGTGWANTVTEDGWRLMAERLTQGRKMLDDTRAANSTKVPPPGWYTAMQTVALGQQWERPEYDALITDGLSHYPHYEGIYFSKAYYLQPKWYGKEGEWQIFAEESGQKLGPEMFTRITWSTVGNFGYDNFFQQTAISWPKLKEGFEAMEKKYPTSAWNLSAFCRFACAAQDKATAKRLFDKLGDKTYANLWGSPENLQAAKAWASSP